MANQSVGRAINDQLKLAGKKRGGTGLVSQRVTKPGVALESSRDFVGAKRQTDGLMADPNSMGSNRQRKGLRRAGIV